MKQKGFTLLELLVVIAIIGLLATVVLVALNNSRTNARNTRRNADIKQMATAFNLGLNSNNTLPPTGGFWACISTTCYGGNSGFTPNAAVDAYLAPYVSKSADPPDGTRGTGGYIYNSNWTGGAGSYDGFVFPAGYYIFWYLEPPATSSSCAIGRIRTASAAWTECAYKFD